MGKGCTNTHVSRIQQGWKTTFLAQVAHLSGKVLNYPILCKNPFLIDPRSSCGTDLNLPSLGWVPGGKAALAAQPGTWLVVPRSLASRQPPSVCLGLFFLPLPALLRTWLNGSSLSALLPANTGPLQVWPAPLPPP